jgi:transcriptional regulator with XRE-family HTH domain
MTKKIPDPIDKHVGARVRMQRLLLGMSQQKLAKALGLTFQQVQKYEKGTNRIGASRLQQIASILQVTPSFFFEGAPTMPGATLDVAAVPMPDYISGFLATVEGLHFVKAFVRIKDPKLRRSIVNFVELIVPENKVELIVPENK